MNPRLLWLAAPIVAGHAGCIAFPATAMALGLPAVMPICGGGQGPLLLALSTMGLQLAATLGLAGGVAMLAQLRKSRAWSRHAPSSKFRPSTGSILGGYREANKAPPKRCLCR